MKKGWMAFLALGAALLTALALCVPVTGAGKGGPEAAENGAGELKVIATVFPAFDFARQLAGDAARVRLLLPPGSEVHSYEPTPRDIIEIREADLFIYVGGESDRWVETILDSMEGGGPKTFRLMDCVSAVEEERSSSMEPERAHGGREEGEPEAPELDEHVWTSPKNAAAIAGKLSEALTALAPEAAGDIRRRTDAYLDELADLDAAFAEAVQSGRRDIVVFGDRFPLRYFADAYGLRYDAAFPGCSEDSEPSVRTVMSLVDLVREEKIPVVFYLEFSSQKTADILAEETGARKRLFHSCHNVSAEELEAGATYVSLMRGNVEALREALD